MKHAPRSDLDDFFAASWAAWARWRRTKSASNMSGTSHMSLNKLDDLQARQKQGVSGCHRRTLVRHDTLLHEHFEHSIFGVAVTRAFARHAVLSGTSRHNQVEVRLFLFPNGHVRRECTMVRHRHGRRQDALDLVRHGDSPAAAGRAGSDNTYTCSVATVKS